MDKPFEYFDIDLAINDKRKVVGMKLTNGIKVVLISNPDAKISSCSVAVGAGYLQDKFEGTAHFLEHLLFMGSSKFPEPNVYHSYVQSCGGIDNAYTGDNITCYFLELETQFLERGIEMLSWFFREPLLDMKHILSEREIINAEHKKNILSDMWIGDDILKKFLNKSKYTNFGTGNSESLRDIKKSDIMDFYNMFYTTDNMYVCILDSLDIDTMKNKYLQYFLSITKKVYSDKSERFTQEKLNLIDENLIVYKSVSQYNFLNIYLIIKCKESNQTEYQLVNLISQLIGLEYINSFSYYLKENDIGKHIRTSVDYYYDYECVLSVNITLINDSVSTIKKICKMFNELLNQMSQINETLFELIYKNFRKMNLLYCLYNSLTDSSEITNEVVNNLIKSNQLYCVIRKNIVPEYDSSTYTQYLKLLNTLEIKITTNVNIEKKKDSEHLASTHYNTKYYIGEFLCKDFKTDVKYNFKNMIPSFDIPIKTNLINDNFNKKEFPKIVFKNSFREVYLLEHNKYNQPMTNISVVRKNSSLIKKTNNLIANIYVSLCNKILNYYLDVMVGYKMSFTIRTSDDCMILNFNGLDYVMSKYISEIVNKITYYSLEANSNTKKYFLDVKRDFIENLTNLKYTSPYLLCLNYSSFLLTKDFLPLEAIDFLNELEYEDFLSQLDKLLVFEKEIFIIVGNLNMSTVELMSDDSVSNALEYVEILSLNSLRYKSLEYNLDLTNKMPEYLEEYEKINYTLAKEEINEQEINNCVLDFYLVKQYKLEFYNGSIKSQQLKLILKDLLIYELMTDLINEPLFDKIRTIDKLGYIVKSMLKYNVYLSNSYIYVFYLVQSEYDIKTIYKSINDFNTKFYKDFKANKDKFKKMFTTLKASKISELSKDTVNLEEEAGDYLSCVVNKYGTFNYKNISLEIMREIKFSTFVDYVDDFFTIGIAVNRNSIILDKH